MRPDPERENAMRERVQALLGAAPEPDPTRLAVGLQVARSANRRRQWGRRAMAWLAAAVLLGAGAATAGWWVGSGESRSDGPAERAPEAPSEPTTGESGANDDKQNSGSGATDRDLIYQGVE